MSHIDEIWMVLSVLMLSTRVELEELHPRILAALVWFGLVEERKDDPWD